MKQFTYSLIILAFAYISLLSGMENPAGNTPLHFAALRNDPAAIKTLIAQGANVNALDNDGNTPLHCAAMHNNIGAIQALLASKANVNIKNNDGNTPLHDAIFQNSPELIKLLVEEGANINAKNKAGNTPLHLAIIHRETPAVIKELLTQGANINATNNDGDTPLHIAILHHNFNATTQLLTEGADTNIQSKNGYTPLHFAAHYNEPAVIKALLAQGADINATTSYGDTPLQIAQGTDHQEIIKLLKEEASKKQKQQATIPTGKEIREASEQVQTESGMKNPTDNTLLHQAIYSNNVEEITKLLASGADVNAKNNIGNTPLHIAASLNGVKAITVLLASGAKVDAQNVHHSTPLHIAAAHNQVEAIKALIEYGADLHAINEDGNTPLHLAAASGATEAIKELLAHNANVNAINKGDNTPLHLAAASGATEAIKELLAHNANVNATNKKINTPLHLAVMLNNLNAVNALLTSDDIDINVTDIYGFTPLKAARMHTIQNPEIIKSLEEASKKQGTQPITSQPKGSFNPRSPLQQKEYPYWTDLNDLETAIFNAVENPDITTLQNLVQTQSRAKIAKILSEPRSKKYSETNFRMRSPLMIAITTQGSSNIGMIKYLLEHGANPNETDGNSHTALYFAIENDKKDVIELLLAYGINVTDSDIHLAQQATPSVVSALHKARVQNAQRRTKYVTSLKQFVGGNTQIVQPINLIPASTTLAPSVVIPITIPIKKSEASEAVTHPITVQQPVEIPSSSNSGQPGPGSNIIPTGKNPDIAPQLPGQEFNQQPKLPKEKPSWKPFGWLIQGAGTGVGIAAVVALLRYFGYLPYVGEKSIQHNLSQEELYTIITEALQETEYKYALDTALANPYACNAIARDVTMQKHLEHLIDIAENSVTDAAKAAAINPTTSFAKSAVSQNLHYLSQLWHLINTQQADISDIP